ncbi:MAG: prephenate dehydrogenase [Endomicrobium sp.]|jgi:prephenate dehydrogenase|nr:prephenate dehydrogenase [Endomicrobium sp.]
MLNLCIVGLGQMGGSLSLALKKSSAPYRITGIVKKDFVNTALRLKIVDEVYPTLESARGADIVVICTPVDTILPLYRRLCNIVNKSAIVTDVGSVKYLIERRIKGFSVKRNAIPFIGVHPMVGREKSGIFSADASMFRNANVIMVGSSKKLTKKEMLVAQMWKYAGAKVIKMPARKHDELVAFTSHLPHVIAFLLKKIYKRTKRKNSRVDVLVADSFKSATRVAVSNPDVWVPIFELNSKNVEKYLIEFIKELSDFKQILKNKQKIKKEILNIQKKWK